MFGIYRIQKGFLPFTTYVSTFLKLVTIIMYYFVN